MLEKKRNYKKNMIVSIIIRKSEKGREWRGVRRRENCGKRESECKREQE